MSGRILYTNPAHQPNGSEGYGSASMHWTELRDERGKLCARLEPRRLILEIRRSDRDLVAHFDLRRILEIQEEIE